MRTRQGVLHPERLACLWGTLQALGCEGGTLSPHGSGSPARRGNSSTITKAKRNSRLEKLPCAL